MEGSEHIFALVALHFDGLAERGYATVGRLEPPFEGTVRAAAAAAQEVLGLPLLCLAHRRAIPALTDVLAAQLKRDGLPIGAVVNPAQLAAGAGLLERRRDEVRQLVPQSLLDEGEALCKVEPVDAHRVGPVVVATVPGGGCLERERAGQQTLPIVGEPGLRREVGSQLLEAGSDRLLRGGRRGRGAGGGAAGVRRVFCPPLQSR